MGYQLKTRKYQWYDFLTIPFQCDFSASLLLGIQKMLTGLSAVVQVVVLARFIDSVDSAWNQNGTFQESLLWFLLLVLCVGWRRISFKVGQIFSSRLGINATAKLNMAFTDKRSKLQYSQLEDENTWNLIGRVCDDPQRHVYLMLNRTYNLMLYIFRIFGVLYIIFTQVWWIGILTSVMCVPLIFISLKSGDKNYLTTKSAALHQRRHQYLNQVLSGRETAGERAVFRFTKTVNEEWYEQYEIARKIRLKANIMMTGSVRGSSAIITLLSSFITIALIFPAASAQITIGMFIALATGMYDLVNMVGVELTKAVSQLSQCKAYLRDLTDFVALPETEGAENPPALEIPAFTSLEFKHVSFCYPGTDNFILKDLSMEIHNGNHYAFVGANGAGKTTIIKLLTGLYDNYEGEILLNGKELRSYTQEQLKAMFCGLYQDFARYHISVKDNVSLGSVNTMDSPEQEQMVADTLKSIGLYEELSALPSGLNTPLGKIVEGGVDLSGGQWQRLAMARTLMSNAPMLILDEPTAALDPISESNIYTQFESMSKGRTTVFISHRLGSTKLADKIFVLDNGHMAEEGRHEELMALDGYYTNMYNSQRRWYQ